MSPDEIALRVRDARQRLRLGLAPVEDLEDLLDDVVSVLDDSSDAVALLDAVESSS